MPKPSAKRSSKRPRRYQMQQKFWLDALDKEEKELADWCDDLRKQRRFTPVVRNGLALMQALEQGNTAVLFRLFPNLYETLYAQMEADVLERRENEAIHRLSKLEALLENLSFPAQSTPQLSAGTGGGIRGLKVPQFTVPEDDDDSPLVAVAAAVDGSAIAANFLRSLGSLG